MIDKTLELKRAALYIRVSSEEQAIRGISLNAQEDDLRNFAKKHKMKIVGFYKDAGVSASKAIHKRAEFMRMIEDVKKDKIDIILIIKLDRWFRSVRDYYKYIEVLEKHNVDWKCTREDYDTFTASGKMMLNMRLAIAQNEADTTSERIKFVFENKLKRGEPISNKVPFGYVVKNKKIIVVEDEAKIIKDMFNKYELGMGCQKLQQYLYDTYNIKLRQDRITKSLAYEIYIGTYSGIENFCPAIISKEQFERCTQIRRRNPKSTPSGRVFLFKDLVYCSSCKKKLYGHFDARRVKESQRYTYNSRHDKMSAICDAPARALEYILEIELMEIIQDEIKNHIASYEILQNEPVIKTKINKNAIKNKMEKLRDLYLEDLIEKEHYEKEYKLLKSKLEDTKEPKKKKSNLVNLDEIKELLKFDFATRYGKLNRDERHFFWRSFIDKIYINRNGSIDKIEFL